MQAQMTHTRTKMESPNPYAIMSVDAEVWVASSISVTNRAMVITACMRWR